MNNETIADIIAEMRVEKRPYGVSIDRLRDYADRLEAARKREPGNAAALREALSRCEAISHLPEIREQQCVKDMRNIIIHALAAPPRNCDLFSSYAEAERYWHENVECAEVNGCFDVWLFEPAAEGGAE